MSCFVQNGYDTDLALVDGKLQLEVDPVVQAAYKLRARFLFFKGEWFLDLREGIPYYQFVMVKNPDLGVIRRLFTRVILSVSPVIESVTRIDCQIATEDRGLAVYFEARCTNGAKISGGTGVPFLVDGNELGND